MSQTKPSWGMPKLDAIDLGILADLQENGRMTNVELARRAGLSAPPCLRRVRALERAGYISGFHADLNSKALGFDVTVFALVGLRSQAEADLDAFKDRVAGWPMVRDCFMLAGADDFLLKIVARDLGAYQTFLIGKLTAAPNVANVKSLMTVEASKTLPGVPFDLDGRD
jgi:DNA-binding Lrp family transcriptional regulator